MAKYLSLKMINTWWFEMTKKLIVKSEMIPYLNLFDLNKSWLNRKTERQVIWESIRQQRKAMYNLTIQINNIEKQISEAIQKLEKKNAWQTKIIHLEAEQLN